ncbi:Arm DNA-binding domain-containing protein [Mesorhizobium atlanticum]
MPLTDAAVRSLKASGKDQKVADSGGLYLLVTAKGGRLWRLKYRFDNKEKTLALGAYPDVGLADARKKRDEPRAFYATVQFQVLNGGSTRSPLAWHVRAL